MLILLWVCNFIAVDKKKMAMKSKDEKKWKMMYYLAFQFFTISPKMRVIAQKVKLALEEEFSRPTNSSNDALEQSVQGI